MAAAMFGKEYLQIHVFVIIMNLNAYKINNLNASLNFVVLWRGTV